MSETPNVLFLVVDSLRFDFVSDSSLAETPTLDALADEGIVFDACYSQGISTAPSMTSILTGRYPLDYGGHWYLPDDQPTMAEQFARNGYTTAAIHSNPNVSRLRNFQQGFDTFEEHILPVQSDGLLDRLPDGMLRVGNKIARVLRRTPYLDADAINVELFDWIDRADEPWFVWTQYMDVHGPYLPGAAVSYPSKIRAERLWRKAAVTAPEDVTDEEHRELLDNYRLEVEYLDAAIGRFLDRLETAGHLDNTIITLLSDHGDEFAEHGLYGHANLPYRELVHVPFIMSIPDSLEISSPDTVSETVRSIDALPTVLDFVEADLSPEMRERMEGTSLRPVLSGGKTPYDVVVTEKQMRHEDAYRFGFRSEEWTYLYDGHEDRQRLFARDTDEQTDIASEHPSIVERFRDQLSERLATITATSADVDVPDVEEDQRVKERLEALGYRE